jgi:MoaD family protein
MEIFMGSRVTLELYSIVYERVGKKEIKYDADTVEEVIKKFLAEYAAKLDDRILGESGDFRKWIQILLNGRGIKFLDGLKTKLKENDVIAIIPILGGG